MGFCLFAWTTRWSCVIIHWHRRTQIVQIGRVICSYLTDGVNSHHPRFRYFPAKRITELRETKTPLLRLAGRIGGVLTFNSLSGQFVDNHVYAFTLLPSVLMKGEKQVWRHLEQYLTRFPSEFHLFSVSFFHCCPPYRLTPCGYWLVQPLSAILT